VIALVEDDERAGIEDRACWNLIFRLLRDSSSLSHQPRCCRVVVVLSADQVAHRAVLARTSLMTTGAGGGV
jgi:hypothetical protein